MFRKFILTAFIVSVLTVVIGSVLPAKDMPNPGISDKLAHVAAYAILALTGGVAFRGARPLLSLGAGLLLLGLSLEIAQAFIPGRSASGYDMLANTIGIALGCTAFISIDKIINRRLRVLK